MQIISSQLYRKIEKCRLVLMFDFCRRGASAFIAAQNVCVSTCVKFHSNGSKEKLSNIAAGQCDFATASSLSSLATVSAVAFRAAFYLSV